jgi:hypothetical protein
MLTGPSSLCQGAEYATVLEGNMPSLYTNCGDGFNTCATDNRRWFPGDCPEDILIQQGSSLTPSPDGDGYNCQYDDPVPGIGDGSGCFYHPADVWVTYYEKIYIGTFGGSDSTVDAWVALDGGPYRQFQRVAGVLFVDNLDDRFERLRLETYMTELPRRGSPAPVTTYVWYDELIVSTEPIAVPGSCAPDCAPVGDDGGMPRGDGGAPRDAGWVPDSGDAGGARDGSVAGDAGGPVHASGTCGCVAAGWPGSAGRGSKLIMLGLYILLVVRRSRVRTVTP